MRIVRLLKAQRGDTIIEVLLAMSVIGLVLGSSYAIANRSLNIGREAQERTEALKLVETQLERLRTASSIRDNDLVDFEADTSAFCIDDTVEVVSFDKPDFDTFTEVSTDEVEYPDGPDNDQPCNQGTDGRYGLTITRSQDDNTFLYTITARWEAVGGGPLRELTSQYRVYPLGNTAFESLIPRPPAPDPDPDPLLCNDDTAVNTGDPLPCEYPPDPSLCNDNAAVNTGDPLPCISPPNFATVSIQLVRNTSVFALTYITGDINLNDDIVTEAGHIFVAGDNTSITLETDSVEKVVENSEFQAGLAIDTYLTGLTRNTQYSTVPYITLGSVTYYGEGVTFTTANDYAIGDTGPGGGKVFYTKSNPSNGWQYMEAFATNTERFMGCSDPPSQLGTSIGTGLGNSATMTPICGSGSPFGYAASFTRSGEDDWFLPSYWELNRVVANQTQAGLNLNGDYWSSSNSSGTWNNYFFTIADDGDFSGARTTSSTRFKVIVVRRF